MFEKKSGNENSMRKTKFKKKKRFWRENFTLGWNRIYTEYLWLPTGASVLQLKSLPVVVEYHDFFIFAVADGCPRRMTNNASNFVKF